MKPKLTLALISVVSAILPLVLGFATLVMIIDLSGWGLLLSFLPVILQAAAFFFVERRIIAKHDVGRLKFWCFSAIPGAVTSVLALAAVFILDGMGAFSGFFGGLAEFLSALFDIGYAVAFMAVFGIMQAFVKK
ncbi:MAG: hypothetical protein ACI4XA_09150 [Oscillospiraceae bacterium]